MDFIQFKQAVAARFAAMSKYPLFTTNIVVDGMPVIKDRMWETYLGSFPEGTNPMFRERTEHDCSCCRQFIRAVGNVVAIINGELVSIWDIKVNDQYQVVADALSKLVKSAPIESLFFTTEHTAGQDKNFEQMVDRIQTWEHFFVNIPAKYVFHGTQIGPMQSGLQADHDVFLRGLKEIDNETLDTVLDLITQNSLYRGQEHKHNLIKFQEFKRQFDALDEDDQELFVWQAVALKTSGAILRLRNSSIGTLLVELAGGMELEDAVKRFEALVAPANYKRPTALVSKAMIEKAKKTINDLGLTSALDRRYAKLNDITINNVLFANRDAKKSITGDVFDDLAAGVKESPRVSARVEEISIEKFLSDVLPTVSSVEVMLDNGHTSNLVSLITAVDPTAAPLFKWNNQFSWSYNGDMADSIKERVKAAGGNVTGELCCRLAWDYTDDLDFWMDEPNRNSIYFGNRRQRSRNGGMLDVDANGADGVRPDPCENIFYERVSTMAPGTYTLKVNNYSRRSDGSGFEVEIDYRGEVFSFCYDRVVSQGSYVEVAKIVKSKDGTIEIKPTLPHSQASKEVWGVKTQQWRNVSAIMLSPNYWDDQGVGNKHYFFMLEGCVNDGKARGFFNEFLKPELNEHRKVLEMVGAKMKTDESENQMSGLGFSSTQRNDLLVRVKGSFTRTLQVTF